MENDDLDRPAAARDEIKRLFLATYWIVIRGRNMLRVGSGFPELSETEIEACRQDLLLDDAAGWESA